MQGGRGRPITRCPRALLCEPHPIGGLVGGTWRLAFCGDAPCGGSGPYYAPGATAAPPSAETPTLGLGRKGAGNLLAARAQGLRIVAVDAYPHGPGVGGRDGDGFFGFELFGEARARHLVVGGQAIL